MYWNEQTCVKQLFWIHPEGEDPYYLGNDV